MEETKTKLRIKLEQLEDDIHKSWLKDQDKTKEMLELCDILAGIEAEESLEKTFENSSDLDYFLKRFTKEVTTNILRQTFVFGEGGDDVALKVLTHFLQIFLKFHEKPQYSALFEFIRDIFDNNKAYYKMTFYGNARILNPKKMISADKYNESLPRKKEKCTEFKPGDQLDVLIENKKCHNLGDRRVWVRGVPEREEGDFYIIHIAEEGVYVKVRKSSFDIAPLGSMTKDYEWRTSLNQWDVIDCYDRGRWYPATILEVQKDIINGLPRVVYKIGFRIYPDKFPEWKSFAKYWNSRGFSTDRSGNKYIGDTESMDEAIIYYSKRIQKFNTFINAESGLYNTKSLSDDFDTFFIDDFIPFEHEGSKNFIVGRGSGFAYYYALLLKNFAQMNGFTKLAKILVTGKPYAELVHTIFHIFYCCFSYFHKDYIQFVADEIKTCAFSYIKELNSNELRNIKKDTLELIIKVLKLYLSVSKTPEEKNKIIEDFSIFSSLRMLKTSFLDKRIQAIKTVVDVIKSNKYDKDKSAHILKMIEENQIFYEIYGPNTHIQLINKSKELLEIMLQEDKLSDGELEMIWAATKKGDLEGKLTILKTLKEISKSLKKKHVKALLEFAYSDKNSGEDLINEEIELIYELSTLTFSEEEKNIENVNKCINYFTKCLFRSKSDEFTKIDALIGKIYDITILYPQFKKNVIEMSVSCLEKNQNSLHSLKILSRHLSDPFLTFSNFEFDGLDNEIKFLFNENLLINLFTENFRKYKKLATEMAKKLQNNTAGVAELIFFDNATHTEHIRVRLEFIQLLQSLNIFQSENHNSDDKVVSSATQTPASTPTETPSYAPLKLPQSFDFISFIYEILIEDSVCEFDQLEFYDYLKKIVEKSPDRRTEERIYKIFEEKICRDTKSCQTLSFQAFESFLMIFLNINSRENFLYYTNTAAQKDKFIIRVSVNPEKLIGFPILWKIVFDSFSNEIMNKGIEVLHILYTNTESAEEVTTVDLEGENEDIKIKIDPEEKRTDILLAKCFDMIKGVIDSENKASLEERRNTIIKCLFFLKLIIEESEKKGTARVKSHRGLLKRKIITLKVDSHIAKASDFTIRVYGNTTMWDLKELIGNKVEMGIDFISLAIKNRDIQPNENGLTVLEMGLNDGDEIKLMMSSTGNYIPQADLIKGGKVVPELLKIFGDWFDKYSADGKQSKEHLSNFIREVTSTREPIDINDQRIVRLFNQNDREGKGWIDRESFIKFYEDCTLHPAQKKTVWDNLHTMGIRNDLKRFDEPLEEINTDKTLLPRYQLAHNEDFFNTLFYLQDQHESIAKEAFHFLCSITTNPNIYKEILCWGTDGNSKKLFNSENIYKLIYSLQIIESFIEDVEIESEGVDCFTNEEAILDLQNTSAEEMRKKKIEWMERFVSQGGFQELVSILLQHLELFNSEDQSLLMKNICLELLMKIVKIFFNSTLNKLEFYKTVQNTLNKHQVNDQNFLADLFEGDLGDIILNCLDYPSFTNSLIYILVRLCNESNSLSQEEVNIVENSFEFLIGILAFTKDSTSVEDIITKIRAEDISKIYNFGIINSNNSTREKFSSTLIKFCKIFDYMKRYNPIIFFFQLNFEIFGTLTKEEKVSSSNSKENKVIYSQEFYDFFAQLFEIYFTNSDNFPSERIAKIGINPEEFVNKLAENVYLDLRVQIASQPVEDINKDIALTNEQFIGHLKILTKVVENVSSLKEKLNAKYNLIQLIMTRVLFKQNSKEVNEIISKMDFINPDKFEDNKNNRNTNLKCRNAAYSFILAMLKNSIDNFEYFFSMNVLENDQENEVKEDNSAASPSTAAARSYYNSYFSRKEDHVGLRNLGCICYMNSMMQQFFMVPSFRYAVLQSNDNLPAKRENSYHVDDNVLHQVQRMFTFLDLSQREDYNPQGFCYSFKDFDGNPTNTSVQQDSQEFLNRFFDKVENCLKPTPFKYVMQSIYGGKTCSQLICEQGCGNVKNRFEDFYNLSLEVSKMKTLNESLEKFISPERIDEYNCETCQKKVTITKRNSLAELPNVLIIHLQRIYYDYEHDRNEKINSRLEFPRVLNLKNYCIEEQMRKNKAKREGENGESEENADSSPLYETDEIYFKQNDYYEYHLVGVNVHIGSADAGHYFSYINTIRKGRENELLYDPKDENHTTSWLKFNDSHISKFNVNRLEEECFGGSVGGDDNNNFSSWHRMMDNSQSAYMLVYERRVKNPIKLIADPPLDKSQLISFKEEECSKIKKQYDINKLNLASSNESLLSTSHLRDLYFYDNAKNEYFQLRPFYSLERLIPREYYLEVTEDNSQFQKHQNILDEQFVTFFENVISVLDETISNMKDVNSNTSSKICLTLLHFIYSLLNSKDRQKLLKPAVDKLCHIIEINKECLESAFDFMLANIHLLHNALHNDEIAIVTANAHLIFELIKRGYEANPKEFLRRSKSEYDGGAANSLQGDSPIAESNIADKSAKLCNYLINLFPRVSYRHISKIYPVYDVIKKMTLLGDEMVQFLYSKESIARFITFLLGKESPCYAEFSNGKGDSWDLGRGNIYNAGHVTNLIYILYQKSETNSEEEGLLSEGNDNSKLQLSENDLKCLKAPGFLKFCFQGNEKLFEELVKNFSTNCEEFTTQSCEEITKYIDDIGYQSDNDFIKLVNLIIPVLNIQDELQLFRFESILGFPYYIIEEPNMRCKWPIFGYNKLPDDTTKWIDYKSTFNTRGCCPLLKKLTQQRATDKTIIEIFLTLLNACVSSKPLLKYIRFMPAEEPQYEDFISWGVSHIHYYTNKYSTSVYLDRLKQIVEVLNPQLSNLHLDKTLIKNFKSFGNKYLPYEVKREEITLLMQGQNLHVMKIEYFTNVIPITKDINYKKSASFYSSGMETKEERKIDETQNIEPDENTIVYDVSERMSNEREFLKRIIPSLTANKKVVIQDKFHVENVTSTMIRYVIFNSSNLEGTVYMKFKRPESHADLDINEFIPNTVVCNINSFYYKNIATILKINTSQDWTNSLNDIDYDVQIDWHQAKSMSNYNYYQNIPNHYSNAYNYAGRKRAYDSMLD